MFSKATRFESLREAVPDALVGKDTWGVIRFVNHQSEVLFGYERADLVARHVETLLPGCLWQVYEEHREDYFADSRSRSMSLEFMHLPRWARSRGVRIPLRQLLSMLTTMPIPDSDDTLDLAPTDDGLGYAASITRRGADGSVRWTAIPPEATRLMRRGLDGSASVP